MARSKFHAWVIRTNNGIWINRTVGYAPTPYRVEHLRQAKIYDTCGAAKVDVKRWNRSGLDVFFHVVEIEIREIVK